MWFLGIFGLFLAGVAAPGVIHPALGISNEDRRSGRGLYAGMTLFGVILWAVSLSSEFAPGPTGSLWALGLGFFGGFWGAIKGAAEAKETPHAPAKAKQPLAADLKQIEGQAAAEAKTRKRLAPGVQPNFAPVRPLPGGLVATLPPADPDPEKMPAYVRAIDLRRTVVIDYVDAVGASSRRQITVVRLWEGLDDWTIEAWCHHRRASRSFLLSRIQTMYLPDTGEIIDSPIDYLLDVIHTPEDWALSRLDDEVAVLVYVARSDGRMEARERDVIVRYIQDHCGDDLSTDAAILEKAIRGYQVGSGSFYNALRKIRDENPDIRHRLAVGAHDVMTADGKTHAEEEKALKSLRKILQLT